MATAKKATAKKATAKKATAKKATAKKATARERPEVAIEFQIPELAPIESKSSKRRLSPPQTILALVFVLVLGVISVGYFSASDSSQSPVETSNEVESTGRLFGGKCASNQDWMRNLEEAITVPADWQSVYDLTASDFSLEDRFGTFSGQEGNTFTEEESVKWRIYITQIGSAVLQGDYGRAISLYESIYPLMEKMDLQCAVAVTGYSALSTTIVP